jgi:hypothetical protein
MPDDPLWDEWAKNSNLRLMRAHAKRLAELPGPHLSDAERIHEYWPTSQDDALRLEVWYADGNPAPWSPDDLTDAQFAYKRGRMRKAEWSAEVFRLTQTSVKIPPREQ